MAVGTTFVDLLEIPPFGRNDIYHKNRAAVSTAAQRQCVKAVSTAAALL